MPVKKPVKKKKITKAQKFALECLIDSIAPFFSEDTLKQINKDIEQSAYKDEYIALRGYMMAKAAESLKAQIERFFKKLLDEILG